MLVNGQQKNLQNNILLCDFLSKEGYDLLKTAVEKNGNIIPKKAYQDEMLCDNDKLEIVHFVGGG
ncbi:MAG: sulfur carrier protein ThiS [Treponema sp.]|nr:sulfur carrier protein ThiS [Treponema sp.]